MTVLRFQTGGRHQTFLASLRERERKRGWEGDRQRQNEREGSRERDRDRKTETGRVIGKPTDT